MINILTMKGILLRLLSLCVLCVKLEAAKEVACDKTPRTDTPQTGADGRFRIVVDTKIPRQYLPDQNYTVRLESAQNNSTFTEFLVMADGEFVQDKLNFRNYIVRQPGILRPKENSDPNTQFHQHCPNSVQQVNNSPKTAVQVEWQAPGKGQGCVTLHAMVVESPEIWYMDDGPLSTRVCEDVRRIEDIEPLEISNCQVCEEAKYELTFEGHWSRNTHPLHFPESVSVRFSDLVGASHADNYYLWDYNKKASPGLKLLAEAGNTTVLEQEIQNKNLQLSDITQLGVSCSRVHNTYRFTAFSFDAGVRTLIKASGHGIPYMAEPTSAIFRVDKTHHLISIAASIVPSPDWFLGVSHFELCQEDNTWIQERELNLYLIDAGTDNGVSYESSNEETLPPGLITRIRERFDNQKSPFYKENKLDPVPNFAKIKVELIRVYKEACEEGMSAGNIQPNNDYSPNSVEDTWPTRSTSVYQNVVPDSDENPGREDPEVSVDYCPLSEWEQWTPCSSRCGTGYRSRSRYHVVNGVEYRYYKPDEKKPDRIYEPSDLCEEQHKESLLESEQCTGPCDN